ncbi:unnamed protein product [Polarella glacialis]|uniref:DUF1499 domain-containing protein n=1 Tax=Polarella glacialis TaxID=89957 RepID=A0A813EQ35_POLGL|nr:unnamed protein product [Polarella glacialis]|mmetsp:Transcript_25118/g.40236  ORF Transcript_25118/g.40236 Transcript_25118/m.40236 type:complete len:215 (+) Transcript_25118:93-737(+)|eukprot:CAMPEP_0115123912 /NCGR_PEP_ID=MMETSP0227-20121206/47910_1 /TAXON_ID=89957 /ORGANISM="Polarella glacialis, Strain CCMP 1383" /LENGTH=214 /DNA_ID=CAMNT_0002526545 /DNA_START=64 /DNA_END=708 /DNA_ORIENTATION=+
MAKRTRSSIRGCFVLGVAVCLASQAVTRNLNFSQLSPPGRRELLSAAAAGVLLTGYAPLALAKVDACKEGANNCFSTTSVGKNGMSTWKWPAGKTRSTAIADLRAVIEAYPKEGQGDVDKGGWSFAVDQLTDAGSGYARLEFQSGIGNFAKFFNGGKPFVDDLEVSVEPGSEAVGVRSASRLGDSDFAVNAKRINYLAAALRALGWDAPGVVVA